MVGPMSVYILMCNLVSLIPDRAVNYLINFKRAVSALVVLRF